MNRLILVSVLITIVYSWEDLKRILISVLKSVLKQTHHQTANHHLDQIVGIALILATIPANLAYVLLTEGPLLTKLIVLLVELLLIGLIAEITNLLIEKNQARHTSFIVFLGTFAVGIVSPVFSIFGGIMHERRLFASYLRHLMFPILFGLILKYLSNRLGILELTNRIDNLISIAVIGLIISITIEYLEQHFRSVHWHLSAYFRVILGVVVLLILFRS
ncbi:MAG: hypothetical protein A3B10_00240 [Candidatus Doudnabacteria bacterium RIFCSPLOWO2_01_FULL_44_21]|uniref:Uncharacterized protein n=1 Tax=Candidatus Doudnabacteria bacterium RIFCSPLOWO2_01_FULL_44_21 TaxID=1817841 RepID=A0A1F5PXD5_9BACT|nr:MAG: hypothetical protein A3B95_03695 [Candidatus Doudnabacteria bacterium RIFCSPHIGHO2_02_FULL_43_13b]OGE94576.1 MAG: hypothetical protein A3B10_00240 [Candidatus Doudnabacteria bacterium RIFCSPLOWO2_01_FULL_44_21]